MQSTRRPASVAPGMGSHVPPGGAHRSPFPSAMRGHLWTQAPTMECRGASLDPLPDRSVFGGGAVPCFQPATSICWTLLLRGGQGPADLTSSSSHRRPLPGLNLPQPGPSWRPHVGPLEASAPGTCPVLEPPCPASLPPALASQAARLLLGQVGPRPAGAGCPAPPHGPVPCPSPGSPGSPGSRRPDQGLSAQLSRTARVSGTLARAQRPALGQPRGRSAGPQASFTPETTGSRTARPCPRVAHGEWKRCTGGGGSRRQPRAPGDTGR